MCGDKYIDYKQKVHSYNTVAIVCFCGAKMRNQSTQWPLNTSLEAL